MIDETVSRAEVLAHFVSRQRLLKALKVQLVLFAVDHGVEAPIPEALLHGPAAGDDLTPRPVPCPLAGCGRITFDERIVDRVRPALAQTVHAGPIELDASRVRDDDVGISMALAGVERSHFCDHLLDAEVRPGAAWAQARVRLE